MSVISLKIKKKDLLSIIVSLLITMGVFLGAILAKQRQTFMPQAGFRNTTLDRISLYSGWDTFTLSVRPIRPLTAQSILNLIRFQKGSCSEIDRWLNGGWDSYLDRKYFNNFTINPGEGYFIRCNTESSLNLIGENYSSGVTLDLIPGWNFVGIPYPKIGYRAQTLLEDINSQGGRCTDVGRWVNVWDTYVLDRYENNFEISNNRAYFIRCEETSSFTPSLQ